MDPITAWALAVKAVAEMITEIVRGQPPEVKARTWQWWIENDIRLRQLFKLEDPPGTPKL